MLNYYNIICAQANHYVYNSLGTACARGAQWRLALALVDDMRAAGLEPGLI